MEETTVPVPPAPPAPAEPPASEPPTEPPAAPAAPAESEPATPAEPVPAAQPLTYDRIVAVVKHQVVDVDGVPEAEFARDLPIPVEARERLIKAVSEELYSRDSSAEVPQHVLDKIATVGDLLDSVSEWAGLNSGAGS